MELFSDHVEAGPGHAGNYDAMDELINDFEQLDIDALRVEIGKNEGGEIHGGTLDPRKTCAGIKG